MILLRDVLNDEATLERVAKVMRRDSKLLVGYKGESADSLWGKTSARTRKTWLAKAKNALDELDRIVYEKSLVLPSREEYITVRKSEYDGLTAMAKRIKGMNAKGNASIEVLQLQIDRARRQRKSG